MGDEKYFAFYCDQIPANTGFWSDNVENCPDNVKYKGEEKYPKYMLVWVVISENGISKALIRPAGAPAMNQYIYLQECLIERLQPFIEEYHSDGIYIFWPNCASSHHANQL